MSAELKGLTSSGNPVGGNIIGVTRKLFFSFSLFRSIISPPFVLRQKENEFQFETQYFIVM